MLEVGSLNVSYGRVQVLHDVTLCVPQGKIICIIGSNGAGKTTLLNAISGIIARQSGSIKFNGNELCSIPYVIVRDGIVHVPEGRKIFTGLSVLENMLIGGYLNSADQTREQVEKMYQYFPVLEKRKNQPAGTLSGGEQQMLALARGLMSGPKLILLDEPSLGLAPIIVNQVFELIREINQMGISVLLVEQNAAKALSISDYAYVLENGRFVMEGDSRELSNSGEVRQAYLGII